MRNAPRSKPSDAISATEVPVVQMFTAAPHRDKGWAQGRAEKRVKVGIRAPGQHGTVYAPRLDQQLMAEVDVGRLALERLPDPKAYGRWV